MMIDNLGGRRFTDEFEPRVLSDEEIEMYLKGDRREVDRLILFSLNRLAACIIPHAKREDERVVENDRLIESLGGVEAMLKRAKYVDTLVKQSEAKTRMMEKVSQSSVTWALIAFFVFILSATWDAIIHAIKLKLGGG